LENLKKFESENRNVETDLRCSVFDIQFILGLMNIEQGTLNIE
jgi:hypothetical protein